MEADLEEFTTSQLLNELYRHEAIIKIATAIQTPYGEREVAKATGILEKEVFNVGAKKMKDAEVFEHRTVEDHMVCEVFICVSPSVIKKRKK